MVHVAAGNLVLYEESSCLYTYEYQATGYFMSCEYFTLESPSGLEIAGKTPTSKGCRLVADVPLLQVVPLEACGNSSRRIDQHDFEIRIKYKRKTGLMVSRYKRNPVRPKKERSDKRPWVRVGSSLSRMPQKFSQPMRTTGKVRSRNVLRCRTDDKSLGDRGDERPGSNVQHC